MSEHTEVSGRSSYPAGNAQVFELFGTIEGAPDHMQGNVEAEGFGPQLFVQSQESQDTLYVQLGIQQHVWIGKIIQQGGNTLSEYRSHDPYLSGKVALAKIPRTPGLTHVLGAFHLIDTELDCGYEYSLSARIHDLAPGIRWLEGTLSRLRRVH